MAKTTTRCTFAELTGVDDDTQETRMAQCTRDATQVLEMPPPRDESRPLCDQHAALFVDDDDSNGTLRALED